MRALDPIARVYLMGCLAEKSRGLVTFRAVRDAADPERAAAAHRRRVCHLSDAFRMVMGQKPVSHACGLPQRTIVNWIALYLPLPWPAGIPTRPEIDIRQHV